MPVFLIRQDQTNFIMKQNLSLTYSSKLNSTQFNIQIGLPFLQCGKCTFGQEFVHIIRQLPRYNIRQMHPQQPILQSRLYTSHDSSLPNLSYPNIKLANFVEIELADLRDSLTPIHDHNYRNQLKECLSKSYNVVHEMQKLYVDLGVGFLYEQVKKLVASYGVIFVFLMTQLDKGVKPDDKAAADRLSKSEQVEVKLDSEKIQVKEGKKKYKKMHGVSLFNESYERCLDYDLAFFRQIRDKLNEDQKSDQQNKLLQDEKKKKFKKEVIEQLNQTSYLKVSGDELYLFLNMQKAEALATKRGFTLGEQLQKIATSFKQSQNQALQFLKNQRSVESFHELTQGFNIVMSEYQKGKTGQIFQVKDRIKQMFAVLIAKISSLQQMQKEKQKQIGNLHAVMNRKKNENINCQTQTQYNFAQEIQTLNKKIEQMEKINTELKNYMNRISDEDKKQRDTLFSQKSNLEITCRQLKQNLQQKNAQMSKLEKRLRVMTQLNKNSNQKDPIQFFNSLGDEMKRLFVMELKQRGFLQLKPDGSSYKKGSKNPQGYESFQLENEPTQIHRKSLRKRESSFLKKGGSGLQMQESETKQLKPVHPTKVRKSSNISFAIQTKLAQENIISLTSEAKTKTDNGMPEKQLSIKSKKFVSIRSGTYTEQTVEKKRVFDIQQKANAPVFVYSQKSFDGAGKSDTINQEKTFQPHQHSSNSKQNTTLNRFLTQQSKENLLKKQEKMIMCKPTQKSAEKHATRESQSITQDYHQISEQSLQSWKQSSQAKKVRKNNTQQNQSPQTSVKTILNEDKVSSAVDCQNTQHNSRNPSVSVIERQPRNFESQQVHTDELELDQIQYQNHPNETGRFQVNNYVVKNELGIRIDSMFEENRDSIMTECEHPKDEHYQQGPQRVELNQPKKIKQIREHKAVDRKIQNKPSLTATTTKNHLGEAAAHQLQFEQNQQLNWPILPGQTRQAPPKMLPKPLAKVRNTSMHQGDISHKENITATKNKKVQSITKITPLPKQYQFKSQSKKLLQAQFQDDEIVEVSREARTVEQFKERVLKMHFKSCGKNCKHLERYVGVFLKLRRDLAILRREQIRIPIENLNQKLPLGEPEPVNLPLIRR